MKPRDLLVVAIFAIISSVQSANILFALSVASISHKHFMDPIMFSLVKKGHNVTVVSPFPPQFNIPGTTNVEIKIPGYPAYSSADVNFFTMSQASVFLWELHMSDEIQNYASATLNSSAFKGLMESGTKFDLIAFDAILNEHLLVLPYRLKAPFILMFPTDFQAVTWWNLNIPYPPSVHALLTHPFPTPMNFWHRFLNTFSVAAVLFHHRYFHIPTMQEMVEKHFPGTPSLLELEKNTSLIFSNTFPTFTEPRPLLPFVVELGGVHCRPANKLPKDFETLVENSGDAGFILVSFGSVANGSFIPEKFLAKLIQVFSTLNQTIILKFEGELPVASRNVKLQKWIPQQDLLGHKRCRLFVTHGGFFSTLESLYHAVPVLVFPLIYDQPHNGLLPSKHGYGIFHNWQQVSAQEISSSMNQLLYNSEFKSNALKMSALFKDRPMDAANSSVYWMEYVIRTGGAHHLKNPAAQIPFFQYILLDVIAFGLIIFTTLLGIVFWMLSNICYFLKRKPSRSAMTAKKIK